MSIITRFGENVSGILNKDNAYNMCIELEKDREQKMKELGEKYDKLIKKYHNYWLSKEGGLVPEQTCGFCGGHSYYDHPKKGNMSVSAFGANCYKIPVTLSILKRAGYNSDSWYDADRDKIIEDVSMDYTHSYDTRENYYTTFKLFTDEEIGMIFDNLVKHGYICYCHKNKPTLTELGKQRMYRKWMEQAPELPEENLLKVWKEGLKDGY